jgi:hypothetical protein
MNADAADLRVRRRVALLLWVIVTVIVWNGLYDVRISLGVRDYLLQAALHDAGRAPAAAMAEMMRHTVHESVKLATFWASLVLTAGLATVWLLTRQGGHAARSTSPAARESPSPVTRGT